MSAERPHPTGYGSSDTRHRVHWARLGMLGTGHWACSARGLECAQWTSTSAHRFWRSLCTRSGNGGSASSATGRVPTHHHAAVSRMHTLSPTHPRSAPCVLFLLACTGVCFSVCPLSRVRLQGLKKSTATTRGGQATKKKKRHGNGRNVDAHLIPRLGLCVLPGADS